MIRCFILFIAVSFIIATIMWSIVPNAPTVSTSVVENALPEITVYKSASCSCCRAWITHLEQEGFKVTAYDREDMDSIKATFGVKPGLASCHTALVSGYVIEGHVPAVDIIKLLQDKPKIIGLTAPGMPKYSPGMQASEQKPRGYDVLTFDKTDNTTVFKHY
ncbi:MAG TPA: DUF411 domain-containing protein [Methylophaga sp.]|nr:DUF411 domain-containing protein [Methylophaga sp.]